MLKNRTKNKSLKYKNLENINYNYSEKNMAHSE